METDDRRRGLGVRRRWYQAVGEAAQAGARLESVIAHMHQNISGTDARLARRKEPITWQSPSGSLQTLHEMVGEFGREGWSEAHVGAAQAVLAAAGEALQRRNRIIHDPWEFDTNGDGTSASRVRLLARSVPELELLRALVGVQLEPAYLEDFEQTVLDLVRAKHQMVMLALVVNGLDLAFGLSPGAAWSLVWGEFDIHGFDEVHPHGPSH